MINIAIHDKYVRECRWDILGRLLQSAEAETKFPDISTNLKELIQPNPDVIGWMRRISQQALSAGHKYHLFSIYEDKIIHTTSSDEPDAAYFCFPDRQQFSTEGMKV
jgi:hypothetical protein